MIRRVLYGLFLATMLAGFGCSDSMPSRSNGGGGSTSPATIKAVHKDQKSG